MQTYSHLLITAALRRGLKQRATAVAGKAFLLGAVLPDAPLVLLTIGYAVYRQWFNPALLDEHIFGSTYDALYFENVWWLGLHNLLHAPLMGLLLAGAGYLALRRGRGWGRALLWFAAGCLLHGVIDIFTHVDDGPLLFFPLNWTYRFTAPVSYWDPRHGGLIFAPLEHLLDLAILVWLGRAYFKQRRGEAHGA
jgi:hypothetical protein